MKKPADIDPEELRSAVHQMRQSEGFMHFRAAFDRKVIELEREIFDPRTPDDMTLVLKKAREKLLLLKPELLAEELMIGADNEIKRLTTGRE